MNEWMNEYNKIIGIGHKQIMTVHHKTRIWLNQYCAPRFQRKRMCWYALGCCTFQTPWNGITAYLSKFEVLVLTWKKS